MVVKQISLTPQVLSESHMKRLRLPPLTLHLASQLGRSPMAIVWPPQLPSAKLGPVMWWLSLQLQWLTMGILIPMVVVSWWLLVLGTAVSFNRRRNHTHNFVGKKRQMTLDWNLNWSTCQEVQKLVLRLPRMSWTGVSEDLPCRCSQGTFFLHD